MPLFRRSPPAFSLLLLAGWLAACEQVDVVVTAVLPSDAAPPEMDAAADAASDAAADGAADAAPDADTGVDTDADTGMPPDPRCPYRRDVADQVDPGLARALCACLGVTGTALTVDAASAGASADLGSNGPLDLQLSSAIAGAVIVADDDGISLSPAVVLTVGGDLAVGGPLEGGDAGVMVAGDAQVAARIDLLDLAVSGTLTQPPGAQLLVANPPTIGQMTSAEVTVAPPCECDPAALLDVGAFVRARTPSAEPLPDGPLPAQRCAQYAIDSATVDALSLDVPASAAFYVAGNLNLDALQLSVAEGAELDVFVEGNLLATGALELGSQAAGGIVRLHVGGIGTIELAQGGTLRGALYAPLAELVLPAGLTVTGAMFVERVSATGALVVHHETQ